MLTQIGTLEIAITFSVIMAIIPRNIQIIDVLYLAKMINNI